MIDMSKFEDGEIFSPIQKELVESLQKKGPMTRAEMVKDLVKPRTTIYDNLMEHDMVKKYSRPTNAQGRPLVFFKLVEEN
jgi:predicted ArsR family transcriptional regulator